MSQVATPSSRSAFSAAFSASPKKQASSMGTQKQVNAYILIYIQIKLCFTSFSNFIHFSFEQQSAAAASATSSSSQQICSQCERFVTEKQLFCPSCGTPKARSTSSSVSVTLPKSPARQASNTISISNSLQLSPQKPGTSAAAAVAKLKNLALANNPFKKKH
jgi:hypothetical protein